MIKKPFLKKRHLIALMAIIILMAWIGLNEYLPIGPGNYNQRQIDKIHAVSPSDQFSFAIMGDNRNGFTMFKKILDDIDSRHYLFALDNGDIVLHGKKDDYRAFFHIIKDEKTPFLTAIGNHDRDHGSEKNYTEIFGKTYYAFDYDTSFFIVLDDSGERIDAIQMKWLEEQLQRNYQHTFVFLHKPPFDPRQGNYHSLSDESNAKEIMSLMEKYKPDIVFASHIHGYFDETRNGVKYVITGGAGKDLHGAGEDHYFFHYVKIDVHGDKVSREVIHMPYQEIDNVAYNLFSDFNKFWMIHKLSALLYLIILFLLLDISIGIFRRSKEGAPLRKR